MISVDFKFYGLGSFYFKYKDKEIDSSSWVSKKALSILIYLLQERQRRIYIEELVDVFWSDSELEDGKKKLYNTIYLLRSSLKKSGVPKDIVESINGAYSINNKYEIWTDWEDFEENINALLAGEDYSIEELKSLFSLYRGEYLSSLKYDSWTELNREKMREYYLLLIEKITERLYSKEKYRDTVNYLHQGLKYDPYRENFYLLYIKTSVKLGKIAEAINSYKKCERILMEELGVLPDEELINEYHKIKSNRELTAEIEEDVVSNEKDNSGAMICEINIFNKIYDLESRHIKRSKNEFVMIKIDFTGVEIPVSADIMEAEVGSMLRSCDVMCSRDHKMYLLLRDMSMINSGIIMNRIIQFFQDLALNKKPSFDVKEIS